MNTKIVYFILSIALVDLYIQHIRDEQDISFLSNKISDLYAYTKILARHQETSNTIADKRFILDETSMGALNTMQKQQQLELMIVEKTMYLVIDSFDSTTEDTKVTSIPVSHTQEKNAFIQNTF